MPYQKLPIGTHQPGLIVVLIDLIQAWINENPHNFPPIVINITDGEPNDLTKTEASAQRLLNLGTTDGKVLLLNAHIADTADREIKLPSDESGLPSKFARLLFRLLGVRVESLSEIRMLVHLKQ
jgi:hypothetical protein